MTRPALYDCGPAGRLPVSEIARRAGISAASVYLRIQKGVTGAALIAPAWQAPTGHVGRKPRLHDCGPHGHLTLREIAERAGITPMTAGERVRAGLPPEQLLAPPKFGPRGAVPPQLLVEITGMAEEIAGSTRGGARPVFLGTCLTRLHRLPRGDRSDQRLVGYYQAAGFDPEAFREAVLDVFEQAREDKLARRRLTRMVR